MSGNTAIEWADKSWNPATGCTRVDEGCRNCYAFRIHEERRAGLARGEKFAAQYSKPFSEIQLFEDRLQDPLRCKTPARWFVESMGDLFHEDIPDDFIRAVMKVIGACRIIGHQCLVLTKREDRMQRIMAEMANELDTADLYGNDESPFPWENLWLGVSADRQKTASKRIDTLVHTLAAIRFLSCEPLVDGIHLAIWKCPCGWRGEAENGCPKCGEHFGYLWEFPKIDWVIAGGETGPNARPMKPSWVQSVRDQCALAGVPFFFKQWGEWYPFEPDDAGILWINNTPVTHCEKFLTHRFSDGTRMIRLGRANLFKLKIHNVLDGRTWEQYPAIKPTKGAKQ